MKSVISKKYLYTLLLLLLLNIISLVIIINIKLEIMEYKVKQDLIKVQKHKESNIISIRGKLSKLPLFSVEVIYKDRPEVKYYYIVEEDGSVVQLYPTE